MSTEIENILELVRKAEKQADKMRQNPNLTDDQLNALTTLYGLLLDIDAGLVSEDIKVKGERT